MADFKLPGTPWKDCGLTFQEVTTAIQGICGSSGPAVQAIHDELAAWLNKLSSPLSSFDLVSFEADIKRNKRFKPVLRHRTRF